MKKEQYLVKCPSRIQFGDPMYYEEYKGKRLTDLVADIKPPKGFAARVVLSEEPLKELPIYMDRQMKIYLAPEQEMKTYMDGYKYENQVHKEKLIGVEMDIGVTQLKSHIGRIISRCLTHLLLRHLFRNVRIFRR